MAGNSVTGMGLYNSSAAYRELGGMLRRLREDAGITGAALAERMDLSPTHVSRMESGKRDSTTTDVVQYVVGCGGTLKTIKPYVELTRLAERRQGYWISDARIGNSLQALIYHESSARRSVDYESLVIPGLLQTSAYTRAVVAGHEPDMPEDRAAAVARTRGERQRVLHWNSPSQIAFYVHEQVLRIQVGSAAIMHEQLLHLVLMSALDNVTLRIVPSAAGARSVIGSSFRLMEFDSYAPLVNMDLHGGGMFLENRDHVNRYFQLHPRLEDVALDEAASRELVARMADVYDQKSQLNGVPQSVKAGL